MVSFEKNKWRYDVGFVGKGSEEKKKLHKQELADIFHGKRPIAVAEQDWKKAQEVAQEKTSQEIEAIRIANFLTDETRHRCGLDSFDIPEENILLLHDDMYTELSGGIEDQEFEVATSDSEHQRIYIRETIARLYPLHTAQTILHEITHQKGTLSFEMPEDPIEQDGHLKRAIVRREGLTAYTHSKKVRQGKDTAHFVGLDEAIIENYVIKHTPRIFETPAFIKEREWAYSSEALRIKEGIAAREKIPIQEIAWVTKDKKWQPHSYIPQRTVLYYVATELAQEFPEDFPNVASVIDRFEDGAFIASRLLSLGRFVERAFGKGSFRLLAEMNDEKEAQGGNAVAVLGELRKRRILNKSHL